ncbi:MAG: hypothetical protein V7K15_15450 [Nostoc sp.]
MTTAGLTLSLRRTTFLRDAARSLSSAAVPGSKLGAASRREGHRKTKSIL